jgi:hypothetical protein
MLVPFRALLFVIALITGMVTSYSVFAEETVFDRLDGKGPSGKRVDVIEWEGNLEIHVYPKGSLQGLSAKLDDRTEGKRVMVIGYRFEANKKAHPLVRRAILGVPFNKNLKAFTDTTEKEFDKLAISNNGLAKPWAPYTLDPSPSQWYPDGHPSNTEDDSAKPFLGSKSLPDNAVGVLRDGDSAPAPAPARRPASVIQDSDFDGEETDKKANEKEGQIKPFTW